MQTGRVFDIKEFSVNDGPGVRTTVFFKGCPLRCIWCHNPEGLEPKRELLVRQRGCLSCGRCRVPCDHPECKGLGRCLHACPAGLVEAVGTEWTVEALAARLLRDRELFESSGGGVTLSGGEPLLQHGFVTELLRHLPVHRAIETSGFATDKVFYKVLCEVDYVMFDLKLIDPEMHRRYTGADNAQILRNFEILQQSGKPYLVRVPLIPDITDTPENLAKIATVVGDSAVELLPYNHMAGAKYASVGKTFTDLIQKETNNEIDLSVFQNATLRRDAH